VTGIYTNNFDLSLNTKNGFPVFATVVEANCVAKKHDLFSAYRLTDEDKAEIEKLAKDPRIGERVCFFSFNSLHILLQINNFCFCTNKQTLLLDRLSSQ
jgi:DNA replicative helicase MCM subunit Mcm2 (Cdc46/Mcm family)